MTIHHSALLVVGWKHYQWLEGALELPNAVYQMIVGWKDLWSLRYVIFQSHQSMLAPRPRQGYFPALCSALVQCSALAAYSFEVTMHYA